jgi:hypothetical protein
VPLRESADLAQGLVAEILAVCTVWVITLFQLGHDGTELKNCDMQNRYDIFGGLPDTIEDDWIESVEKLEHMMDEYIHLRQRARDVCGVRYQETIDPEKDRWELCSRVLARRDVVDRLSTPW